MDANQTRFQLVFGEADWFSAGAAGSPPACDLEWRASDGTVGLAQKLFVFSATPGSTPLSASDRRGAAQDRYGNYYWISPAQDEILFQPAGQRQAQHFWSAADLAGASNPSTFGMFSPVTAPPEPAYAMGGLTVTSDHYLLVGLTQPAGLLLFDLYAGSPPLQYDWPAGIPFEPFDMAATSDGGAWILDRCNRCYWGLDPYFQLLAPTGPAATRQRAEYFQPATGERLYRSECEISERVATAQAMPVAAADPIGIAALPDGSVLILDSPVALGYSQVYRYQLAALTGPPVGLNQIDVGSGEPYALLGQDLAFVSASSTAGGPVQGTLYVADSLGAQTFAFDYSTASNGWALEPSPQFLPMKQFGGKALVTGAGPSYDFGETWVPLLALPRARFEELCVWHLPQRDASLDVYPEAAFDGKEPGCVWHRLMMDGTIPAGTQVLVQSRAADSKALLMNAAWNTEPLPYLRATGSELPYYQPALNCSSSLTGTWELLFQAAKGRYLQLQLTFSGNGNTTPRIQAVRAYYPRFSYLTRYLPGVYQNNAQSASFLERFLANPEGFFTAIEGRIQQVQELFDARTVPAEYLPWLAGWLGICFDFTWGTELQRFFLTNAPRFFQTRGTLNGMVWMIRMSLDQCADASLFEPADAEHFSVHIVENYQLRSAPGVVLGDPTDVQTPGVVETVSGWTPAQGSAPIDQLFRSFLSAEYGTVSALNLAWGGTAYTGFDDATLRFPAIQPAQSTEANDWTQFIATDLGFTYALVTDTDETAFEDFLTARYQQISALNTAYGLTASSALTAFSDVQSVLWPGLGTGLPTGGVFLQDWILFVSVLVPTQQNAHAFSVVVPVELNASVTTQMQRQSLAQRIAQQEKPAHTSFNVKLYWAAFCVGDARVGIETVVGPSSRFAALLLDQSTLGASYLSYIAPWNARGRMVTGRDQLRQPIARCCGETSL